ncbi:hypothetical protein ACFY1B_46670 [Streptomyces mirabilis]|uniref:hypothetical protein n=1 Tax=Streptomyces mirabilis TaxID=68239 RepID=UPI0036842E36
MNRPTNRIQELQQHQPLGFFARWGLRAAALGPLGGAHGRSARGGPNSAAFSSLHFLTFYSLG